MSLQGRRPAWMNRELWLELREKKRVYNLWKKGQETQEDLKDVMRPCREKITWFSGGVGNVTFTIYSNLKIFSNLNNSMNL